MCLSFALPGCSQGYLRYEAPTEEYKTHTIRWQEYTETALVVSKSSKRPVLLYFTLEGCPTCTILETAALNDPEVAYYVTNNYVPIRVKIGADRDDPKKARLLEKYEVEAFPTVVILSSKGHKTMFHAKGAADSETFLEVLAKFNKINTMMNMEDNLPVK